MALRNGFQRMLSSMQKQREDEPAALAATAEELRKLSKVNSQHVHLLDAILLPTFYI